MNIKKIFSVAISCAALLSISVPLEASATTTITSSTSNSFGVSESVMRAHKKALPSVNIYALTTTSTTTSLPSSVDLSTSIYFPPVGNQGSLGSCAAFSTTYYQFTYEANKLNNVVSNSTSTQYSPKWTYNLNNGGDYQSGVNVNECYNILENFGCPKWSELPYGTSALVASNYQDITVSDDAKRNALNTRLSGWHSYEIPTSPTVKITDSADSKLDAVKTALNSGHVLETTSYFNFNDKYGTGNYASNSVAYRCTTSSGGHAFAIVGYDDNVTCDVNNNGVIDAGEKGAFKMVNSWGTTYHNSGYEWILYDALNTNSVIPGNWESSLTGTRVQVFNYGMGNGLYGSNWLTSIDVSNYNVMFVGQINVNTNDRTDLKIRCGRTISTSSTISDAELRDVFVSARSIYPVAFNGKFFYDYSDLVEPINTYYTGFKWWTNVTDLDPDGYGVTSGSFSVVDNFGNLLTGYSLLGAFDGSSTNPSKSLNINYILGDVDYDGAITVADRDIVGNYIIRTLTLSNFQFFMADLYTDGVVDIQDIIAYQKII